MPASCGTQKLWITLSEVRRIVDGLAGRQVDLVGGLDPRAGYAHAPPPELAGDVDAQLVVRGLAQRARRADGDDGEHREDQDRHEDPADPDERVVVRASTARRRADGRASTRTG